MIHGIKIEMVDKAHLQAVLQELNDPAASEKDAGMLVAAAVKHFGEGKDLAVCDRCGGRSPENLDACPFCGEAGDAKLRVVQPGGSNGTSESPKPGNGVEPVVGRPTMRRRIQPENKTIVESAGAMVVHEERSLVTVADLDREVARYCQLKADAAVSLWRVGAQINILHTTGLWKKRVKESGGQAYKNWNVFCEVELKMTHGTAFDLMEVNKKFTEEQAAAWGTSKCSLLLRAPEPDRPAIEEKIRRGASYREVKATVRDAKVKAGTLGKKRDTGRKVRGGSVRPHRPSDDKVKVVFATRRTSIEFVTKASARAEEPKPAKNLADEPVAHYEMKNGTILHMSLARKNSGQIVCVIQATRE